MKIIGNLQVEGENSLIKLNSDFSINREYSGYYVEDFVGEEVTFGKLLYYNIDTSRWHISDNVLFHTLACQGIALNDATTEQACRILKFGTLRNDNWWFTSNVLYVGENGDVTTDIPTQFGSFVQAVGTVVGENIAFFDFNTTIIENA